MSVASVSSESYSGHLWADGADSLEKHFYQYTKVQELLVTSSECYVKNRENQHSASNHEMKQDSIGYLELKLRLK